MKPVKLFLVDDDKIFIFLTKKIIEDTGIDTDIHVFTDGQESMDYLKAIVSQPEFLPDIICLDLSMPVMDGWEFLNEYNAEIAPKLEKQIPLYLVSSSISPHDIERAKSIGIVSDFIIKPVDKEKVKEVIKNI